MPSAALAKDASASLFGGNGTLVFHKVKSLKKAGKTIRRHGVYFQFGAKASASGLGYHGCGRSGRFWSLRACDGAWYCKQHYFFGYWRALFHWYG